MISEYYTAQKMKFSTNILFSKCDQFRRLKPDIYGQVWNTDQEKIVFGTIIHSTLLKPFRKNFSPEKSWNLFTFFHYSNEFLLMDDIYYSLKPVLRYFHAKSLFNFFLNISNKKLFKFLQLISNCNFIWEPL